MEFSTYRDLCNFSPPRCEWHDEQMILHFYDRPGGPPGNGWVCRSCLKEKEHMQITRFPEGAEL